ncbi:MAG: hypothetical protein HQL10_10830 [Nitrospirae bacterium]|nr:hypothetical protein [Nitrospirota bacterium]
MIVIWVLIIVFGLCTAVSFYMAHLSLANKDSGVYLFASFGLFFCIPFLIFFIKAFSNRVEFFKRIDEKIAGKPQPIRFVPHRFLMAAIIIIGIVIAASIIMGIIRAL